MNEKIHDLWIDFRNFYTTCVHYTVYEKHEEQIAREISRLCTLVPKKEHAAFGWGRNSEQRLRLDFCYYRLWRHYNFTPYQLAMLTAMINNEDIVLKSHQTYPVTHMQKRIGAAFKHICLHEQACPFKKVLQNE